MSVGKSFGGGLCGVLLLAFAGIKFNTKKQ